MEQLGALGRRARQFRAARRPWTDEDRLRLLQSARRHGCITPDDAGWEVDCEAAGRDVWPTRSASFVLTAVSRWLRAARHCLACLYRGRALDRCDHRAHLHEALAMTIAAHNKQRELYSGIMAKSFGDHWAGLQQELETSWRRAPWANSSNLRRAALAHLTAKAPHAVAHFGRVNVVRALKVLVHLVDRPLQGGQPHLPRSDEPAAGPGMGQHEVSDEEDEVKGESDEDYCPSGADAPDDDAAAKRYPASARPQPAAPTPLPRPSAQEGKSSRPSGSRAHASPALVQAPAPQLPDKDEQQQEEEAKGSDGEHSIASFTSSASPTASVGPTEPDAGSDAGAKGSLSAAMVRQRGALPRGQPRAKHRHRKRKRKRSRSSSEDKRDLSELEAVELAKERAEERMAEKHMKYIEALAAMARERHKQLMQVPDLIQEQLEVSKQIATAIEALAGCAAAD